MTVIAKGLPTEAKPGYLSRHQTASPHTRAHRVARRPGSRRFGSRDASADRPQNLDRARRPLRR